MHKFPLFMNEMHENLPGFTLAVISTNKCNYVYVLYVYALSANKNVLSKVTLLVNGREPRP